METLKQMPQKDDLLNWYHKNVKDKIREVNGHIHTPYSFSAFNDIEQAFRMAKEEDIDVLGINDFFVTDGYDDFARLAEKHNIFPLFNIEFIGLLKNAEEQKHKVNDPKNPGRTYFSGKGLDYPLSLSDEFLTKLNKVKLKSQDHMHLMIEKANKLLCSVSDITISYKEIKETLAKELVRERHIAQVIRIKAMQQFKNQEALKSFLQALYSGTPSNVDPENEAALENEIRSMILKKGGAAFVPEDPQAFMNVEEIIEIILNAGGIPCYPVLLDDPDGNFTDFEGDWDALHRELTTRNIGCLELIPGRNDLDILTDFVKFFDERDFIILLGTEHNTPKLDPLKVSARNGALNDELKKISFKGACVIAAHQYLRAKGEKGYIMNGKPLKDNISEFSRLGNAAIEYYLNHK